MEKENRNVGILKKIFLMLSPPQKWRFMVIIVLGIFVGLGLYVFHISNAVSYLSDAPETCTNCHVMNSYYATWQHGSHSKVATCNDCHVPQDNFVRKYWFKANDGLRHATYFTMRWEPQVIQIKQAGREVVQENCVRCHTDLIHPIALRSINNRSVEEQTEKVCWDCHRETPHGKVNSLSSAPYARVPQLKASVPEWIMKLTNNENKNK